MGTTKIDRINANDLVAELDAKTLADIALNTNVDFHARKLRGETMLKLFIEGILMFDNNLSLSTLKSYYQTDAFVLTCNLVNGESISKAGLSKRLASLNPDYFKEVYISAVKTWGAMLDKSSTDLIKGLDLEAIDSTLVRETTHILKTGISAGLIGSKKKESLQVKYTMGFNGKYATEAIVRLLPKYASEENSLGEAIIDMVRKNPFTSANSVYIFDRGISSSKLMASFENENIRFVGRVNARRRTKFVRKSSAPVGELPQGVTLIKDEIVQIYGKDAHNPLPNHMRVISVDLGYEIGRRSYKKSNVETTLSVITDEFDLSVSEILEIYRYRWKIEVFFKFLKQHFDFKHLMSGSENGLTNMLYLTLITALLVKTYCVLNAVRAKNTPMFIWMELDQGVIGYVKSQCFQNPPNHGLSQVNMPLTAASKIS